MPNYNPYYPSNYQSYGYQQPYQQYQQPYQQPIMQQPQPQNSMQPQAQGQNQPQQQPQIQNGGFVGVRSVEEAKAYPVAPGNCVTFKVENQPIVIEKSMGFSQLESPRIDMYKLVEIKTEKPAEYPAEIAQEDRKDNYALKSDLLDAISDFDDLRKEIERLKKQLKSTKDKAEKEKVVVSKNETTTKESEVEG